MLATLFLCTLIRVGASEQWKSDGSLHIPDQFRDPKSVYRPKFRYWMPDASISSENVARDIREAKAIGAGGLEFLPFYTYGMGDETYRRFDGLGNYPEPDFPDWNIYGFGTPSFVSLFKESLEAAKESGILMDFALGANQGQGVPAVPGTAGLSIQLLMGNTTIHPGESVSALVPEPQQPSDVILSGLQFMHPLKHYFAPNLTAVVAYELVMAGNSSAGSKSIYLNEKSFLDLTELVKEDLHIHWSPPNSSNTWKLFSFWESYTNQRSCDGGPNATNFLGNGSWTVDHFSKTGASRITDFWDEYLLSDGQISRLLRSVGKYAWEDSMEQLAALPWTPGLLDRFQASYGYELKPHLPLLFSQTNIWGSIAPPYAEAYYFNTSTTTVPEAYQLDFRKVLNDGYQDYISHFQKWTKSIGVEYSTQPAYNLPLQMSADIPLVDAPEAESLGFQQSIDQYRQFCGPAHLFNKSVISTELGAVRIGAYVLTIPELLQQTKRSFAGGFTMNVLHGFPTFTKYPNTTWPGYTPFFYEFTEMWNQVQPAWRHIRDSLDYIGRNQWALQQGTPKVDLAFYLFASPWKQEVQYNSSNLADLGFTYEYIGPDNIASDHARVLDGGLGAPGYRALIFNNQTIISTKAAGALINITSSGIPLIFVGSIPAQAFPTSDQDTLGAIMEDVLRNSNVHRVESIEEIPALLTELKIRPRVALDCSFDNVYSVYRSASDADYVFFFNDQSEDTECAATISISGVTPYILNAWTGSESRPIASHMDNSTLSMPIILKGNETLLVALRSPSQQFNYELESTQQFVTIDTDPLNLTTWDLTIEDWHSAADRFAVETEVTNHTLHGIPLLPWKQLNASLESVSGIGHYTTSFSVPSVSSNKTVVALLELPLIQHTARVFLDDNWLGPIDPVNPILTLKNLEAGDIYNLRIEVTTTLLNRIKADAKYIRMAGTIPDDIYEAKAYADYGLVGQVTLEWGQLIDPH
ncbi:hypothetical protein BS50DRAFT_486722 [Corynespora cassiicola Philippines]|uniref:Secreted protein n=1 Tax=Corynespora cassiicola Philippines TaxID=1448308 RepID=A0A2T2P2G3_CORCC|nr:hypothetical protein BS50DRAFT_486722 [Corynespora cassiicola Philippines]